LTAFEYITVPVSIILALGLGKVLTAMMVVIESGKRDWLHLLWCVVLVLVLLGQWVAIWRLHPNEIWSAAEFFVVMASPILFYAAAHLLVSNKPESIASWSSRLDQIARPLLSLMALSMGNFFLRNFVILENINPSPPTPGAAWIMPTVVMAFTLTTLAYPTRLLLAATALVWLSPIVATLLFVDLR
jgi:peptidoglycan/LPS O-acetylase OafA/YrhL